MTGTTSDRLRRAPAWQRAIFTGACAYEITAMWSNLPTFTYMGHRQRLLAAAMVVGLTIHLIPKEF